MVHSSGSAVVIPTEGHRPTVVSDHLHSFRSADGEDTGYRLRLITYEDETTQRISWHIDRPEYLTIAGDHRP